ncbi:hypothetical protein LCGC14_1146560 [marine sediment metagenome]|uniref:Uncharacterized protein n=1 Tax=marine sediment metagenome TaxID=412755 RepID=A0A0F9Q2D9_9ZZZZ
MKDNSLSEFIIGTVTRGDEMTKQEEIGDYVQSFIEGIMEDCQRAKSLGKGSFDWGAYLVIRQQEFREGLASKGVVIK